MAITVESFLLTARSARALVADPAVAGAWAAPSALPGMTVGGLAAHLGAQVLMAAGLLRPSEPPAGQPVVTAAEHYARASWVDADREADVNLTIRDRSEELAAAGPEALISSVDDALRALADELPGADLTRPVPTPAGPWSLPLGQALLTRALEIAVHSDDLAASVGLPTPDLPDDALRPVLELLVGVAARRHGQAAVLRTLTRAERAPRSISAFGPA